ncbi:hypothetical protein BGZ89_006191, partial [Linnemannia elongata]
LDLKQLCAIPQPTLENISQHNNSHNPLKSSIQTPFSAYSNMQFKAMLALCGLLSIAAALPGGGGGGGGGSSSCQSSAAA